MRPHVRPKKIKSGTGHEVIYSIKNKKYSKWFSPQIPIEIVEIWASEKGTELAYAKAGLKEILTNQTASQMTLTQFGGYYSTNQKGFIKQATIKRNLISLQNLIKIAADIPLLQIEKQIIRTFVQERIQTGHMRRGINRDLSILTSMFNLAKSDKLITENPFAKFGKIKQEPKSNDVLTDAEINQYKKQIPPGHCMDAFMLFRYTGCRRRSLSRGDGWTDVLKWKDINFELNQISLIQKGHRKITIPMHRELNTYLSNRSKQLTNPTGNVIPYHSDTLTTKFSKYYKASQIPKKIQPIHGIRHAAATKLIDSNVSLKKVSAILGHTRTSTTEIYTHLNPDSIKEDINEL